ncbi:EAL domain-containing protein [Novosphingobium flavum]|uniref:putative bifunctional diguanylate cyclase/phosphodiesterase n=1 Tax=Novosphingobium aerophilum TaxID=2839843 RepID=UPI00163AD82C|nr:EAL domain-containing protein [Novosphingobium aerophilum]MBC2662517.1 EAL domain-containing protein [Novosphingobium aerophilum]
MSLRIGRSSLLKKQPPEPPVAPEPNPLAEMGQAFLQTFETIGQGGFWMTDAAGALTYLSAHIRPDLLGEEAGPGGRFIDLFEPVVRTEGESGRTLQFVFARKSKFDGILVRRNIGRGERIWELSGEAMFDPLGEHSGFRGILKDVTEQHLHAEEKSQLVRYDPLTGLTNRHRMGKVLEQILTSFDAGSRCCTVMLLDLDRFKQVNDTLGHAAGDALLKQVAERLITIVGDKEAICRLGGDEFQIVLRDQGDQEFLGQLAYRIIEMLSQPYRIGEERCTIGASIGIAISPRDGTSADELTRNADLALYSAKNSGRGGFRFFTTDYLKAATERRELEEDLHLAIERDEFQLYYQPVVDAWTDTVVGAEALIRWIHPVKGFVSPAQFIPLAEESNLICRLGEFALRRGCSDAMQWPKSLRVAINVSPVQFAEEDFVKIVQRVLRETRLPPERLELEITESVFVSDDEKVQQIFQGLKNLGVRLALDDFGTGYSSLGYLRRSPFDKLKIDQSFIRGATEFASRNRPIVEATATMAQALSMVTTAEGVETFDQLDLVRAQRVNYVQGYIYSKPISAEEFLSKASDNWQIVPSGPARQRADRLTMYRAVGVVHHDTYQTGILRNLSTSGALIEGLTDMVPGEMIAVDLGSGQIAVAQVIRVVGIRTGVAFEIPLVPDGAGGLCTLRRISSFDLWKAGLPVNKDDVLELAKLRGTPAGAITGIAL